MASFTDENDEFLVELIGRNPPLYDSRLNTYKDSVVRDIIWEHIGRKLNKTSDDCRKRWKCIRDSYQRIKRKNKLPTGSAAGSKSKKWSLLEKLKFLENVPSERKTICNIERANDTLTKESDASSQHSQSTTSADYSNRMSPPPMTSTTQPESCPSHTSNKYSSRPRRTKEKQDETDGVPEALNRLENEASGINNPNEYKDEFHFFGLNVASQLRNLPLYEALGVQAEIQNFLTSARRRNMYPQVSTLTYSTLESSNTQTNTLPALHIQPITYSTLPASNTQTNPLLAPNIQPMTYSTLSTANTQINTLSSPKSSTSMDDGNEEDGREMEDVGEQEFNFAIKTEIEDNPVLNEDVKPPDGMNTSTPPAKRRRLSASNALNNEVVNQLVEEEMDTLQSFQQEDPKYDDLLFLKSLLPFVRKIDPVLKLKFRIRIHEVVEEFAHGDSKHAVQVSLGTSFSSDRRPSSTNSYAQLPPENPSFAS